MDSMWLYVSYRNVIYELHKLALESVVKCVGVWLCVHLCFFVGGILNRLVSWPYLHLLECTGKLQELATFQLTRVYVHKLVLLWTLKVVRLIMNIVTCMCPCGETVYIDKTTRTAWQCLCFVFVAISPLSLSLSLFLWSGWRWYLFTFDVCVRACCLCILFVTQCFKRKFKLYNLTYTQLQIRKINYLLRLHVAVVVGACYW